MSTQVRGEYEIVMRIIQKEIKKTFLESSKAVFAIKYSTILQNNFYSIIHENLVYFGNRLFISAIRQNILCWLCAVVP